MEKVKQASDRGRGRNSTLGKWSLTSKSNWRVMLVFQLRDVSDQIVHEGQQLRV